MATVTEAMVRDALARVIDPDRQADIVSLGMVSGLAVKDGHVVFAIEVDAARGPRLEPLRKTAERTVQAIPGVITVSAALTAERKVEPPHSAPRGHAPRKELLPDVGAIIAVASGKGGVGKSTTSANLALALSKLGLKVGLFDADVFGPSQPRMMGIEGRPTTQNDRLVPMQGHGIACMSMGFLVNEGQAIVWRGPMVMGALQQLLGDVAWGRLDVMVIDMPPGTGDTQLTITQSVPLTGAVIVSTPQDIALLDARKGVDMFGKTGVPILGIIENMSTYVCPKCGHEEHIFGHGGARDEAARLGVDFLGEIPLDIRIRQSGDSGTPIVAAEPDGVHAQAYIGIAKAVWAKITEAKTQGSRGPKISIQ